MVQEIETDACRQHPLYRPLWKTFLLTLLLTNLFDYHWYKNILQMEGDHGSRLPHKLPLLVGAVLAALYFSSLFARLMAFVFYQKNIAEAFELLWPYAVVAYMTMFYAIEGYKVYISYYIRKTYTQDMERRPIIFSFPIMVLFPVVYSQFRLNRWIKKHMIQVADA
ncbi:MAG: hypothetical protein R6W92_09550 [Desulfocurvibacter africanus]